MIEYSDRTPYCRILCLRHRPDLHGIVCMQPTRECAAAGKDVIYTGAYERSERMTRLECLLSAMTCERLHSALPCPRRPNGGVLRQAPWMPEVSECMYRPCLELKEYV